MKIAPYAKAFVAFISLLASAILSVISGDQTFADINTVQWVTIVATVSMGTGAVFGVPNSTVD